MYKNTEKGGEFRGWQIAFWRLHGVYMASRERQKIPQITPIISSSFRRLSLSQWSGQVDIVLIALCYPTVLRSSHEM